MFILPPPFPPEAPQTTEIQQTVRRVSQTRVKAAPAELRETVRPAKPNAA